MSRQQICWNVALMNLVEAWEDWMDRLNNPHIKFEDYERNPEFLDIYKGLAKVR
jgi:hypothetical protein